MLYMVNEAGGQMADPSGEWLTESLHRTGWGQRNCASLVDDRLARWAALLESM